VKGQGDETLFGRVLVAFDASPQGRRLLELAGELARCFEAPLSGLFIEQEGLLDFAALPNATEVTLGSATIRPLSRERMQAHCHAQARTARRYFESLATRHRVSSSFSMQRGRPEMAIASIAEKTDLVLLSPRVGFLARPSAHELLQCLSRSMTSGLIVQARSGQSPATGSVLAVIDAELPAARATLSAARSIAKQRGLEPGLILRCDIPRRPELIAEISDLDRGEKPLVIQTVARARELAARISAAQPSLIVLSDRLTDKIREDLFALGRAVLVVRTEDAVYEKRA
jgi:nucleotide-binding universal stress UspA family protein